MRILLILLRVLVFLALSTINFEYLLNRQSSTVLLVLCIVLELVLIWLLIVPLIKKITRL